MNATLSLPGYFTIGVQRLTLFGGPCMAESLELCCEVAAFLREIAGQLPGAPSENGAEPHKTERENTSC